MAGENTPPDDEPETSEEREKSGNGPPHPETAHVPIECDIVNLNALDNEAHVLRTGKKLRGFQETATVGVGGSQFLVTLTLSTPLGPDEVPLTVDVRYTAVHDGTQKPSGLFLYKQTDAVTFHPKEPNQGDKVQPFHLQTIRFTADLANHDAEITIEVYHGGHKVSNNPGKFTLKPGP